jgi:hypothetical protein
MNIGGRVQVWANPALDRGYFAGAECHPGSPVSPARRGTEEAMTDGGNCIGGHEEGHNVKHFSTTMTLPGWEPAKIVCCHSCATAITVGDPRLVVAGERSQQLKAAITSSEVEFTKPVPLS